MKNIFKRLMAALMLVCMMLSFVVPATFAEDPAQPEKTTYDFYLADSTDDMINDYTWIGKDLKPGTAVALANGTADATYANYVELIDALYADESCAMNWRVDQSKYKLASSNWRANEGLRIYSANEDGMIVFRLKAPTAEPLTYNVALNVSNLAGANTADIYLLPATDDLDTALAAATPLFSGTVTSGGIKNDRVELSGEEFMLVVKHKTVGSKKAFSIKDLTLTPVLPDVSYNYDFRIYNNADFASGFTYTALPGNFEGHRSYNGTITISKWFQNNYPSTINWGLETTKGVNNSAKDFWFRGASDQGLRLQTYKAVGNYAAVRIYVEQPETYNVSLLAGSNTGVIDTYIFKAPAAYAGYAAASAEAVDAAIADESNLLAANVSLTANAVSKLGQWTCEEGGDYIVVFKTAQTATEGYDIKMLTLATGTEEVPTEPSTTAPAVTTPDNTTVPEQTTVPEVSEPVLHSYDFNLHNETNYIQYIKDALVAAGAPADCVVPEHDLYKCTLDKASYTGAYKWFHTNFPKKINWSVEGNDGQNSAKPGGDFIVEAVSKNGLGVNLGKTNDEKAGWAAFRIDVKAAGIYKLDLSMFGGDEEGHIASGDVLDVYLFEAFEKLSIAKDNVVQINDLLGEETYVGSLTYETPGETYGKTSYTIRSGLSIEAAGQYVVVIRERATDTCQYAHLDTLTLTPADTADDVEVPDDLPKEEEVIPPEPDKDGDFTFDVVTNYPTICGGLHVVSYKNSAKNKKGNDILDANGKSMSTETYLASLYAQGYIDWVYEDGSFKNGKGGENMVLRQDQGLRINGAVGDWAAFRLSVPAAGEYNLMLTGNGTNTADIYFVKATEGLDPSKAMTAENLLIGELKSAAAVAVKEKVKLEAGDYFLIIKHTVAAGSDKDYWTMNRLQLEPWTEKQPKPMTDKMVYDFDMGAIDERFLKKSIANRLETGGISGKAQVAQWYAEGKLHWVYEGNGAGMTDMTFRENAYRIRTKTSNFKSIEDSFVAFRIENPGTGKYDVRLVTDGASMVCMDVYLVPLKNTLVLTPEKIKEAMVKENLLVSNAQVDEAGTFYLGEYTFGMEDEYLMVFEFTKGTALFLSQVEMTKDGLVANGTVKKGTSYKGVVYDLDLADAMDGIYPESKLNMPDVIDDMNARWRSGAMNWKYINASDGLSGSTPATDYDPTTNIRFYRATGMRLYSTPDSWMALKIKSPGSGDFTITLNHATTANSGTIAMYILPADTDIDKLWEATDPENRVGKVYLGNDDGDSAIVDGSTSFVGYWNFEAGEEYILVIEGYEKSKFNSRYCYMNMSQIIMERGIVSYEAAEQEKQVQPITVEENAIPVFEAGAFGATTVVNGHDWMFMPMEGGYTLVYDLDTYELVDTVYTTSTYSRNMAVGPEGNVYTVGTGGRVHVYDPITMEYWESNTISTAEGIGECSNVIDGIAVDENGIIWLGTHYGAQLVSYDINTKEFTYWGQPCGYQLILRAMVCRDGFLYAVADGETEHIVFKMDTSTGEIVATQDISHLMGTATYCQTLNLLENDYLIAGGSYLGAFIAMNPETLELVEVDGVWSNLLNGFSEKIDGKYYGSIQNYGLYEYDVATKTFSKTPGSGSGFTGFRTSSYNSYGTGLVTIDGDPCLITYGGNRPKYYNMATQEHGSMDDIMKPEHADGSAVVRGFIKWEEGSNRFSFGAFNTELCSVYNTELGKIEYYYKTGGQTDSQIWYEGKLYAGNYSSTTLNEIYPDPALGEKNEIIQRWRLDHEETGQKRVHCLAAGDGYVFAGTTPDTNLHGGGITVYDTRTGRWKFYRNPVENGSIMALGYHDELLYATTTCNGGSGSGWAPGTSAVIFVFDYEAGETVAVLDPRDYIKGLASPVYHVRCVVPDPNIEENGRIWSMVSETLFCFTFDKETKKFDVQEVISFDKSTYSDSGTNNWFPKTILFDMERNYVYASFHGNGGMQRLELENWNAPIGQIKLKSNERIMSDIPESNFMVLGDDGNLYYGFSTELKMLPLNVTDEDWAIAQKVDNLILAIGDEITVESEAAIRTARSAYENSSWYYKALIQELETLQEAESDILERKIDTYDGVEMTADHFPEMSELMAEYKGLNKRQQRYVKNYDKLKEAYDKASDLNDQRIAKAVQEKINGLKDKFPLTLDNEPEVLEIRAEVNSLTGKQYILLDLTILEDAEAQIKVLRAEFVKYVETLIQAIPNEITLDAEPAITAAREAADKLYINERKEISYSKLTSAEGKLRTLKNAKAAAEEVDALIKAIGIVTLGDKDRIAEAREAYDALNETALGFLTKGKKLETAEFILKALQTWGIPVITVVNAGIAFAVIWFVPSLHSKVFKSKKKEESIEN